MKTRRLTTLAMLTAIYAVLSILTPIRIQNFKFTFEAFPVLVAGLLLGPLDGFIVGTLGSGIYQLFFSGYGITITTPLWILPHAASGLLVGYFSKRHNYVLDQKQIIFICILSALCVTSLNILALYVDARIYGYYSFALVFGNVLIKIITGIILAIIYASIMPKLLKYLHNQLDRQNTI